MQPSLNPADYETPELDPTTQRRNFSEAVIGTSKNAEARAIRFAITKLHPELAQNLWTGADQDPTSDEEATIQAILEDFIKAHTQATNPALANILWHTDTGLPDSDEHKKRKKGDMIRCTQNAFQKVRLALMHSVAGHTIYNKSGKVAPFAPGFFAEAEALGKEIDAAVLVPQINKDQDAA